MVKNMVKDLSKEQLAVILTHDVGKKSSYVGSTLREFIEGVGISEDATLTELYEAMQTYRLAWPFRLLHVTCEATISRGYSLAVLDDETIHEYGLGKIELEDIDPKFNLEKAYEETASGYLDGYINYDYAVHDDREGCLVDWD